MWERTAVPRPRPSCEASAAAYWLSRALRGRSEFFHCRLQKRCLNLPEIGIGMGWAIPCSPVEEGAGGQRGSRFLLAFVDISASFSAQFGFGWAQGRCPKRLARTRPKIRLARALAFCQPQPREPEAGGRAVKLGAPWVVDLPGSLQGVPDHARGCARPQAALDEEREAENSPAPRRHVRTWCWLPEIWRAWLPEVFGWFCCWVLGSAIRS